MATADGGGIYYTYSSPTITGCTISGNMAQEGAGIFCFESGIINITLSDTIVCSNAMDQIYGSWIDDGGNTVQEICTGACCLGGTCITAAVSDCTAAGGTYAGDVVDCADAGCTAPPVTGACCVSSGCASLNNDECTAMGGNWLGEDGSCDDCPASCSGDTNNDGVVNLEDLLIIIDAWGPCP